MLKNNEIHRKTDNLLDFKDDEKIQINNRELETKEEYFPTGNRYTPPNLAENAGNEEKDGKAKAESNYDLSKASHPVVCVFTFLFKVLAILSYLFWNDLKAKIAVIVFSAFDFWMVKNVSGRLLVGLRWWSDFKEDGTEVWVFESHDQDFQGNKVDMAFFWTSQIAATVTWTILSVLNILGFNPFQFVLTAIAAIMSFVNLYGYYKCRGEHNKKVQDMKNYIAAEGMKAVGKAFFKNPFMT